MAHAPTWAGAASWFTATWPAASPKSTNPGVAASKRASTRTSASLLPNSSGSACFRGRRWPRGSGSRTPEVVQQVLAKQGGRVLILSSHHANWEWLLARCSSAFDEPLTAAYKPTRREYVDRVLRGWRERFGCRMVKAKDLVPHLLEQRGKVRLLAMLADQSPPARTEQQAWIDSSGNPLRSTAGRAGSAPRWGTPCTLQQCIANGVDTTWWSSSSWRPPAHGASPSRFSQPIAARLSSTCGVTLRVLLGLQPLEA